LAKYCWEFSSPVNAVPHGEVPPAQLLRVPRTRVPVGSSLVCSRSWPAAGPVISIGVVPVSRRLSAESRTTTHCPDSSRRTSTMLRPWAASSVSTISWLVLIKNSGTSGGASSESGAAVYSGLRVR
jgi:hypothetical protein